MSSFQFRFPFPPTVSTLPFPISLSFEPTPSPIVYPRNTRSNVPDRGVRGVSAAAAKDLVLVPGNELELEQFWRASRQRPSGLVPSLPARLPSSLPRVRAAGWQRTRRLTPGSEIRRAFPGRPEAPAGQTLLSIFRSRGITSSTQNAQAIYERNTLSLLFLLSTIESSLANKSDLHLNLFAKTILFWTHYCVILRCLFIFMAGICGIVRCKQSGEYLLIEASNKQTFSVV